MCLRFKSNGKLAEYVVSVQTIEVLYQQGLMWMTMPIYPYVAWIMPFLFYINFKFEKIILQYFKSKSTAIWSAEDVGSFLMIFQILTILITWTPCSLYFMYNRWTCANLGNNAVSSPKGPFIEYSPLNTIGRWFEARGAGWMFSILLGPLVWVSFLAMSFLESSFARHRVNCLEERSEKKEKVHRSVEDHLQKTCTGLNRKLEMAQKKLEKYEKTT